MCFYFLSLFIYDRSNEQRCLVNWPIWYHVYILTTFQPHCLQSSDWKCYAMATTCHRMMHKRNSKKFNPIWRNEKMRYKQLDKTIAPQSMHSCISFFILVWKGDGNIDNTAAAGCWTWCGDRWRESTNRCECNGIAHNRTQIQIEK